jgi:hypothetical protein
VSPSAIGSADPLIVGGRGLAYGLGDGPEVYRNRHRVVPSTHPANYGGDGLIEDLEWVPELPTAGLSRLVMVPESCGSASVIELA